MKGLMGKKIGVAATRQAENIAALIQKNGGIPFVLSIQGEQKFSEDICEQDIKELLGRKPFDIVLLTTGIGIETLEQTALRLHLHFEFMNILKNTNLAIRGRKVLNWTKKHSLFVKFVSEDGTMENLLKILSNEGQKYGRRLFLQAYNQDDAMLKVDLENLGYDVYLSKPYRFIEPPLRTVRSLQQKILNQTLDAIIFTSKTQVRNLFHHSASTEGMVKAFNQEVLAVAVGKVTASELEMKGITNVFQPSIQKMGVMVVELREYLKNLPNRQWEG